MTATVPVYEWLTADDAVLGCGTQAEFDHWVAEGVNPVGSKLGNILCHEDAADDEFRAAMWAEEPAATPTTPKSRHIGGEI